VSRRGRWVFVAACLAVFALIAAVISWSTSSDQPSGRTPATVTLAPGATRPPALTVTDLRDLAQLRARFNADEGAPRLLLALAPT
jgi:hypothetical protein